MATSSPVLRTDHGAVTLLTLNRPDRRNALGRELVDGLSSSLEELRRLPDVRVVVLAGAGPTFSAGLDMKEALQRDLSSLEAEAEAIRDLEALAELLVRLHRMPQPTLAALHGDALGGGAGLALTCDFVIADQSARIGFPEVRRGLVPSVVMGDVIRLVGERRSRQLLLSGQPIDARTAHAWGLLSEVTDDGECLNRALDYANDLVCGGPRAIETTKRLLDEATGRPHDLRGPAAISAAVRVSEEAIEGMSAFLERRPPRWARGLDHPGPTD